MSKMIKRSAGSFELQEGFKVHGNPIVYNQKSDRGDYYEVILNGALDYADLSDISLLINHNFDSVPLARYKEGDESSTMSITINENGLFFESILDENNPDCQKIKSALKRNDLNKMSFCFLFDETDPTASYWDKGEDKPIHYIRKITKVLEISIVTWPAYKGTNVGLRSEEIEEIAEDALFENFKKREAFELEKARILASF